MADPALIEFSLVVTSSFLKVFIPVILVIALLNFLAWLIKRGVNRLIGKVGEKIVSKKLNKFSSSKYKMPDNTDIGEKTISRKLYSPDSAQHKLLNNLVLPSKGNTKVTQIDQVIVSNYGIFVVETKSYKGWIFGNANQEYWTQAIFKNKERFYNPLRQNFAHIKAIKDLLKPNRLKASIVSLIAFPYADKLKISGTNSVGYMRDIIKKIESYKSIIYSDTERDEIFNLLSNANIIDREVNKQHSREIRELKESKKKEAKLKELEKLDKLINE
jgi:hypothetical protein